MNSLYTFFAVFAALILVFSTVTSIQQQASGIIINWSEEFRVLTDEFEEQYRMQRTMNLETLPVY